MGATVILVTLGLLLALALGCTALVLVAIVLSLVPPELEDRHERQSGQSVLRGLRRDRYLSWPEEQARAGTRSALQRVPASAVPRRGRPR
jgi:hypothetical protein